jgi:hypothetical protein
MVEVRTITPKIGTAVPCCLFQGHYFKARLYLRLVHTLGDCTKSSPNLGTQNRGRSWEYLQAYPCVPLPSIFFISLPTYPGALDYSNSILI